MISPPVPPSKVFGPFFNGKDYVFADVVRVHRRLTAALDGEPNTWLEKAEGEDVELASEAKEKIDRAVRLAFDIAPFDTATGDGQTEGEVMATLDLFIDLLGKPAPTPEPSPTSSPVMGEGSTACRRTNGSASG